MVYLSLINGPKEETETGFTPCATAVIIVSLLMRMTRQYKTDYSPRHWHVPERCLDYYVTASTFNLMNTATRDFTIDIICCLQYLWRASLSK